MKQFKTLIITIIATFGCIACSSSAKKAETILTQWSNKYIQIPESLIYTIKGDTINYNINACDFKIFTYIDSAECIACRLMLPTWKSFLSEINSITDIKVNFIMVLSTTKVREVEYLTKRNDFNYPICIDTKKQLESQNKLPKEHKFRTFLLNSDNKILAIGNPVQNPNIKELYINIIKNNSPTTTSQERLMISASSFSAAIGALRTNEYKSITFKLRNYGNTPLVVSEIVTSCECITASVNNDTLYSNQQANVNITCHGNSIPGEFERYVDIFFKDIEQPATFKITGFIKQ